MKRSTQLTIDLHWHSDVVCIVVPYGIQAYMVDSIIRIYTTLSTMWAAGLACVLALYGMCFLYSAQYSTRIYNAFKSRSTI